MNTSDKIIASLLNTLDQKFSISESSINKILYLHSLNLKHLDIFCNRLQKLLPEMIYNRSLNITDYQKDQLEDSKSQCLFMLIYNQIFIWQLLNIDEVADNYFNNSAFDTDRIEKTLNYIDLNYLPNMSKQAFEEKTHMQIDELGEIINEIYSNLFSVSSDYKETSEILLPVATQISRSLIHSTLVSRSSLESIIDEMVNPPVLKKAKEIIRTEVEEKNQLIDKEHLLSQLKITPKEDMASYSSVELMHKMLSSRQEFTDPTYNTNEKLSLIDKYFNNKYDKPFSYGLAIPQNKEIGLNIKNRRKEKGLAQEKLASEIGCTKQYISKIELGERNPTRKFLGLIANTLDATIDLLYGWSDSPMKDSAGVTNAIQPLEINDKVISFDDFHYSFYHYQKLSKLYMHCVVLLTEEQLDNVCTFLESALKIYGYGDTTNQEVNKKRKEKSLARMGIKSDFKV